MSKSMGMAFPEFLLSTVHTTLPQTNPVRKLKISIIGFYLFQFKFVDCFYRWKAGFLMEMLTHNNMSVVAVITI